MLFNNSLIAFVPTNDATNAKRFYEDVLGLRFVSEDNFAIVMDANGTMLRITNVGAFTPHPFTILGWHVDNIGQAVAQLTAKGVAFQHYSFPGQSPEGIWTSPAGAKVAWFHDPDGNTLSLTQF
jgi:catechol 2,3-dioxygenase-like lactoylglutathione lyase family enzyme